MRIGYLTSQYPAPSHTFIRREVEALRRRGVDIACFSIRRPPANELATDIEVEAFKSTCYVLPLTAVKLINAHTRALLVRPKAYFGTLRLAMKHRAPGLKSLIWAFFHFLEAIYLAQALSRQSITHLHNHFANAGANVGLFASHYLAMPWSLTLHGISETDYPSGLLLADKIAHARFVACVSWFGRAQAMRLTPPEQWSKFLTVRCGVSLDAIDLLRGHPKASANGKRIICVGRLSSEKAHAGLLQAFTAMVPKVSGCRLVLIGDGPDWARLQEQALDLNILQYIDFLGRKAEEETLMEIARSDMLVLPSFMEGLPVVLIEAMALEVPVVASHVAGIPELVADGKEGLLFRPADWSDLNRAIVQMLEEGETRAKLVRNARKKVEAEFNIDVAVEPLLQFFQSPSAALLAEKIGRVKQSETISD